MGRYIGMGFPLSQKGPRGWVELKSDSDLIRDSLVQIFGTYRGERRGQPEFGCRLRQFLLAPNTEVNRRLIAWDMLLQAERWEPRVRISGMTFLEDATSKSEGRVMIQINYIEVSSGSLQSMTVNIDKQGALINV